MPPIEANNRASSGSLASRASGRSLKSSKSSRSKRRTISYSTIPMLRDLQMAKAKVVDVNHDRYVTHYYKQRILTKIEKKE